ncbi:alpha-N-acetylglucosaminidase [Polaribacter reichenbachii]|uniref:Alpha-N-acetylglucosaminidase n=1 Tax=Polaribacter reichenbachii TaxID=996801 RepID=A0A1B8U1H7_9FLAO|nr:alpha-N-acetylglucosaminidase [Polaribacter reichenbachii]APZ47327.1 alpha-N-acetylglucosaminidase [Polaribacter reichenbachii]AUC17968.1 alpha-N-acetylglucosaminidase [Polaribacter reichenbachii]OBY65705.1 alpha-N-acetylglucosaminidase [Polaribacter reichenbachii]
MKLSISLFFVFVLFVSCKKEKQATNTELPEMALIKRIAPNHASQFIVEIDKISEEEDWFEIESKNDKIILRGNNGVSIASAFYYYLKEYTNSQITWNGTNLNLPKKLPALKTLVHKKTPYEYRYYLNYCTFNYTMSWWDWERWEKEIDWMALHGINMPLAITGEEYIWDEVYKSYGFTDADLSTFFSGPAYFSWFWMGNLDGWGGPLSQHWKDTHRDLQIKILKRERALGMKPVLPAFTGHVPASFKTFFPEANLKQTNWGNDFSDTYILDANDPLFAEIGKKFLESQQRIYGTDHLYSADTFNENTPPSNDPEYLSNLSSKVYEGMKSADPDAVWVMQGWLFYSHRDFWQAPQIKGLLTPVPDDKMIILDLASEIEPVWKRTEAFYGKQWIWNMLHSFGGNISMFGRIETVANEPAKALNNAHAGKLKGIGLTMESIEQNPVLYELMTDNTWRDTPIDLKTWLERYTLNRYGQSNTDILKAWDIMVKTVYNGQVIRDGAESIIVARPTFEGYRRWARTKLNYAPEDLLPAWDLFVKTIPLHKDSDGFEYDLVDVTRQVLANYALPLQQQITTAYRANNKADFDKYSNEFIALIDDMDTLLGTRKDFLLGPWIADARSWGQTEQEKALYEQNARDLITLWGDANNRLHEYSNRQWSGLLSDFYKPRWEQFFATVKKDWNNFDQNAFDKTIKKWEWNWVTARKDFPVTAQGNAREVVKALHKKYRNRIQPITAKMQPIQYNY